MRVVGFGRRKGPEADQALERAGRPRSRDVFAAQVVAGHDDGWSRRDATVVLDGDGLEIDVSVGEPGSAGSQVAVPLYLSITGDRVPGSVFASFSGYGGTEKDAVVEAACLWTCSFVPALRSGYGSHGGGDDVVVEPVTIDGRGFHLHSAALGRALMTGPGDPQARIDAARRRFSPGQATLSRVVATSGLLPVLSSDLPTVLSVFVADHRDVRTVEVKVNGSDWPSTSRLFDGVPPERDGAFVLLRELAVLVPQPSGRPTGGATGLPSRAGVEEALRALSVHAAVPGSAAGWPGWQAHRGRLGPPLRRTDLAHLGSLPPGYEALLEVVGAPGAGPGYGMLRPRRVGDAIPLAHAGCGCTWIVRLDAQHFGEVWVDASGSDHSIRRVATSADEWYARWLDHAQHDAGPWIQWNSAACASTGVFGQILQEHGSRTPDGRLTISMRDGALAMAGGGAYLEGTHTMDPCQGCVSLAVQLGLSPRVFVPGVLSSPGSVPGA